MAEQVLRKAPLVTQQLVRLPPLPTIRQLLRIYRLHAQKSLSQNFLLQPEVIRRVVDCCGDLTGKCVVEIGPGPGGITRELLRRNLRSLTAIELDHRFLPHLEQIRECMPDVFNYVQGNILIYDMHNIFPEDTARDWHDDEPPALHLVGNLPFSISTPLIIRWLQQMHERQSVWRYGRVPLTLCFQHEICERMVAPPGSNERNRLSIICQNFAHVEYRKMIKGSAFLPKPAVNSGVVTFIPRKEAVIDLPWDLIQKVLRCVLSTRKNEIRYSFHLLLPKQGHENFVSRLLAESEIHPESAPIALDIDAFKRLCWAYKRLCDEYPILHSFNTVSKK